MKAITQTQMYLVYIDESKDENAFVYSAMFIDAFQWNAYFARVLGWRQEWFQKVSIPPEYELHATKLVGGKGQPNKNRDKMYRANLFHEAIGRIERMEGVKIINAITSDKSRHMHLFRQMLTCIHQTLQAHNAYGLLICDEGNEGKMTSSVRKMKKENIVRSNEGLRFMYNKPLDRIIEDPLFKSSHKSYFIQLADFLAFSLLRNEYPIKSTQGKVKEAFNQLDKVLVKEAFKGDSRGKGIIRV